MAFYLKELILFGVYFISLYIVVFWLLVLFERDRERKKVLKNFPLVSVLIPAYNEEKSIARTIKSVLELDYPNEKLEVIAINDGSTDNTRRIIEGIIKENKAYNIKLINQKNMGKGAALNAGLKICKGEFFASLDADSFVRTDALKKLLPYFKNKNIASVLPLLKVEKPKNLLQRVQWYEYLINMFYKKLNSRLDAINVTPGPFSLYKTSIIKDIGYYDENNLTEDQELAIRLQKHNYKIIQTLDTDVYTLAPKTFSKWFKQRKRWYIGSVYNTVKYRNLLFRREYGDFAFMLAPIVVLGGILGVIILSIFVRDMVKGLITFFHDMYAINFSVITLLKGIGFNFNLLDLNYIFLSMFFFVALLLVFVLINSHKMTNEKMENNGKMLFSLVYFAFIYSFMLAAVWLKTFFDIAIRKKHKWENVKK